MKEELIALKPFLETICKEEKIAGMALAITDRNGLIFSEGFGVESCERVEVKVSGKSTFKIASITKIVTGMTLLSLVEEGKLSLDTKVKEILPWLTLADKNTEENVTLRHLLSHTSGLEAEYTPDGFLEESSLEYSLREGLPYAQILYPLGQGYRYSNWGIRLASAMAEKVSGERFSQLATKRVLAPLNMTRTTFDLHVAATWPLSLPHTENDGVFKVCHRISENAARYAAGGLFSNAEDLCRLARCLLNDGLSDDKTRILSARSIELMKTPHARRPDGGTYGLTMEHGDFHGGKICLHRGSAPPYSTSLLFHPESGLGIATLMNTQRDHLRTDLPKAILERLLSL